MPGAHYFVGGNTKFYGGSTIAFQDRRSMAEVQPTNGQDIHHRPTETDWDLPQLPAGRFRCLRIRKTAPFDSRELHEASSRALSRLISVRSSSTTLPPTYVTNREHRRLFPDHKKNCADCANSSGRFLDRTGEASQVVRLDMAPSSMALAKALNPDRTILDIS